MQGPLDVATFPSPLYTAQALLHIAQHAHNTVTKICHTVDTQPQNIIANTLTVILRYHRRDRASCTRTSH